MTGINSSKKSVEVCKIVKRFGGFTAVDNVSINIAPGEFCSLLGPSGSGKTTLLKIIAGYEDPTEGIVKIDGQDVGHVPVAYAQHRNGVSELRLVSTHEYCQKHRVPP
jgi:ABC-type Fe3+/spermidine/putrescine transport system ATPase subunit